jgi:hypothetical protein
MFGYKQLGEKEHFTKYKGGGEMKNVSLKMTASSTLILLAILVMVFLTNIPEASAKCWSMLKTEDEDGATSEGPFVMKAKYSGS